MVTMQQNIVPNLVAEIVDNEFEMKALAVCYLKEDGSVRTLYACNEGQKLQLFAACCLMKDTLSVAIRMNDDMPGEPLPIKG